MLKKNYIEKFHCVNDNNEEEEKVIWNIAEKQVTPIKELDLSDIVISKKYLMIIIFLGVVFILILIIVILDSKFNFIAKLKEGAKNPPLYIESL